MRGYYTMSKKNRNIEKYDFNKAKRTKKPYAMILSDVVQKTNNIPATFIWIYLETLPEDWDINKNQIINHFGISEKTYRRHMAWLKASGLIEYRQERHEDGTFGDHDLIVLDGLNFKPAPRNNREAKNDLPDDNRWAKKRVSGETALPANDQHTYTNTKTKTNQKTTKLQTPQLVSSFLFSESIDKKILAQKLERDPRSDEEFLEAVREHVDNHSDKQYPRFKRANAAVKLLKSLKDDNVLFNLKTTEEKPEKEKPNSLFTEEELLILGEYRHALHLNLLEAFFPTKKLRKRAEELFKKAKLNGLNDQNKGRVQSDSKPARVKTRSKPYVSVFEALELRG